jgi:uncharacterized small protein (DUF1192 family)
MDEDDLEPTKTSKSFEPRVFDTLSVEELTAYIEELKSEIARAEAAIDAKKGFRDSAEGVFRR